MFSTHTFFDTENEGMALSSLVLTTIATVNFATSLNNGVLTASVNLLMVELDMTSANVGVITGCRDTGILIASAAVAIYYTTMRPLKTVGICGILFGLMSLFTVWSNNFWSLYISRILLSVFDGTIVVLSSPVLDLHAPPSKSAWYIAIFYAAQAAGQWTGSGITGPWLDSSINLFGLPQWRSAFLITGLAVLPPAIFALMVALRYPIDQVKDDVLLEESARPWKDTSGRFDNVFDRPSRRSGERAQLTVVERVAHEAAPPSDSWEQLKLLCRNQLAIALLASIFFFNFFGKSVITFIFLYVERVYDLDHTAAAGMLSIYLFLAAALGSLVVGQLVQWVHRSSINLENEASLAKQVPLKSVFYVNCIIMIFMQVGLFLGVLAAQLTNYSQFCVAFSFSVLFLVMPNPAVITILLWDASKTMHGVSSAAFTTLVSVSHVAGPPLLGLLLDTMPDRLELAYTAWLLLAVIFCLVVHSIVIDISRKRKDLEQKNEVAALTSNTSGYKATKEPQPDGGYGSSRTLVPAVELALERKELKFDHSIRMTAGGEDMLNYSAVDANVLAHVGGYDSGEEARYY